MQTFDKWISQQPSGWTQRPDAFRNVDWNVDWNGVPLISGVQIVTKMIELGWNPCDPDQIESPLVVAQSLQDPRATMRLLINLGVDVNAKFRTNTPLYWSIDHGLYENAEYLIIAGAQIRWLQQDFFSCGPLHARRLKELQQLYRGIGHCRVAQRAAARALAKMNKALRDVAIHVIAPLIWETRGSEEWSSLK
jgi:hypothetical protein